jgi:hypothetical protein
MECEYATAYVSTCDRTSKTVDYATLLVATDSCGVLRIVQRELNASKEDDRGSFQPTG